MIAVSDAALDAACVAARAAIDNYSKFDSSMVPDDALRTVVAAAFNAGVAVLNLPPKKGTTHV